MGLRPVVRGVSCEARTVKLVVHRDLSHVGLPPGVAYEIRRGGIGVKASSGLSGRAIRVRGLPDGLERSEDRFIVDTSDPDGHAVQEVIGPPHRTPEAGHEGLVPWTGEDVRLVHDQRDIVWRKEVDPTLVRGHLLDDVGMIQQIT